ncbi:hypothetical protein EYC84_007821 [Monilinia fructicola]|uniref:Uncharacterized protein n=1 Tax=Monilinia fructicola TaxID=38448 RepID=A0A5M9JHS1_MONFR|nr:hypothetical protein EYC84_007821 [Monilinia fructicola]
MRMQRHRATTSTPPTLLPPAIDLHAPKDALPGIRKVQVPPPDLQPVDPQRHRGVRGRKGRRGEDDAVVERARVDAVDASAEGLGAQHDPRRGGQRGHAVEELLVGVRDGDGGEDDARAGVRVVRYRYHVDGHAAVLEAEGGVGGGVHAAADGVLVVAERGDAREGVAWLVA